jgi:phosphate transport system protein
MHYEKIATHAEAELGALRESVMQMGLVVSNQAYDAVRAFVVGDLALARQVRAREKEVNAMELVLDHKCTEFVALRQPAALDLRQVLAASKVIENLERVGDEAKTIAKVTEQLAARGELDKERVPVVEDIARDALVLFGDALKAYASLDAPAAETLLVGRMERIDERYQGLARQTLTHMMENPHRISWGLDIMRIGRAAARIGELARHIAQHTIFITEARDVRHGGLADPGATGAS